jgi:hypothetical protein
MLLKSDWFAIALATFGVAVVVWQGWSSRNEYPAMKKIIYTLLVAWLILWLLIAAMIFGLI